MSKVYRCPKGRPGDTHKDITGFWTGKDKPEYVKHYNIVEQAGVPKETV